MKPRDSRDVMAPADPGQAGTARTPSSECGLRELRTRALPGGAQFARRPPGETVIGRAHRDDDCEPHA